MYCNSFFSKSAIVELHLLLTIRKEELEDLALSGRIPAKSARDAQRFTFLNNFKRFYQNHYGVLPETEQTEKAS